MTFDTFAFGWSAFDLSNEKKDILKGYKVNSIEGVRMIAGGDQSCLVWSGKNELYLCWCNSEKKKHHSVLENEEIMKITANNYNNLILTRSGKVYSIGDFGEGGMLPFQDPKKCHPYFPRLITWFIENNLKVIDIACNATGYFYITSNKTLYSSGSQIYKYNHEPKDNFPIKVWENVDKVMSGVDGLSVFLICGDELYAYGRNEHGKLGLGYVNMEFVPALVPNFKGNEIKNICCRTDHTLLLTKTGKIYYAGKLNYSAKPTKDFILLDQFKDKTVQSIGCGSEHSIVITTDKKFYIWGVENLVPTLMTDLDFAMPDYPLEFNCGLFCNFLYPSPNANPIIFDFLNILINGEFSDYQINQIKCHTFFLELRTGHTKEEVNKILENYNKTETFTFLKWVYSGIIDNYELILEILKKLNLQISSEREFLNLIKSFYNDNNFNDITILIKKNPIKINEIVNKKERKKRLRNKRKKKRRRKKQMTDLKRQLVNHELNEKQLNNIKNEMLMNGKFLKIKMNRFILLVRSGLYRSLFKFTENTNNNQIKDYSRKSVDSLQIFYKYFYTNEIEFFPKNSENKRESIINELNELNDYFQFNRMCKI
ncbi:hypothetical protein M0812_12968 [Anaeramoeba flamelloides]|uniref:BTB domain-containing protein n=1 Tax=Anaeramoeba flamelloides TaxID=1746091 RepID=A0AAV7ZG14_9EUKA|nr:hypothetical protein M0812_12968 [Anaeramoeba flamelloides]